MGAEWALRGLTAEQARAWAIAQVREILSTCEGMYHVRAYLDKVERNRAEGNETTDRLAVRSAGDRDWRLMIVRAAIACDDPNARRGAALAARKVQSAYARRAAKVISTLTKAEVDKAQYESILALRVSRRTEAQTIDTSGWFKPILGDEP